METKKIDVLLVNPGARKKVYQQLGAHIAAIEPPIWAGLLASFIRRKGYVVDILDANAEELDARETAQRVSEIDPLLTAIVVYGQNPSASTMVMPAAGAICTEIKQLDPAQKLLLLGGHVAALPEKTLEEESADFVCDGEGPYTLLGLIQALRSMGEDFSRIKGLVYRQAGRVVHNEPAPLVTDLESLMPGLAWDLLPMDRYRAHNWHCFEHLDEREPYATLYTSLGCPFGCHFCCIQAPFKTGEQALGYKTKVNSYRRWHPDSVIDQIDTLVTDYGVKNIKFADELFVLNKKHVMGICDHIIQRGYDLNIWAYARVDSWTEEMLTRMKAAGINWLCLGIESGSSRVRNDVRKGYRSEDLLRAVKAIREAGIYIIANYLFGLPEENLGSMRETLSLAMELNCEFANFYCAMAYPGSNLYRRALAENLPLPENWTGYSQHAYDTLPLPTNYLSGPEVLEFRDSAFHTYFSNPGYLQMIRQTFGEQVVDHIKEISDQKLDRKYTER
ncbi:COG1032: Fe-S oxidoreductase [Olavius algarvensis associated proteobacterium Delta 3]|nr:COG1032: Fe-S oxidoreductase [Olavius algarvensis associated proteobacterium Delta 3]